LGIVILVGWVVYAAVFVHRIERGEGETLSPEVQQLAKQELQEEWFVIYQHDRRAGYSHTELQPQEEGYALVEELFLRLDFLGEIQDVFSRIQAQLAQDFSLKSFVFRLQAGPITFRLKGGIQDNTLSLVTWMSGQERVEQVELAGPVYLGGGIKSFLSHQRLRVGDTYRLALFDPATFSQTPAPLLVEAKEIINIGDRDQEAFRVVLDFHGAKLRSWITPYGEVLKEEGFLGMTLLKTDADDALKGLSQSAAVELVREAAVVPDRRILRPRELQRLELQVSGVYGDGWDLAGDRQVWRPRELTIVKESLEDLPGLQIPIEEKRMARDLQSSLLIQSDAPELKKEATTIIGEERDGLKAVRRLSSWVYGHLEKRPTLSIPSALDVWKRRAGDCNEHSVLFAALARAVGIPTRVVAGLLYSDGRFFYHAWNEVYLGRWVTVDALLNQVPADPTHLRLVIGGLDQQVKLVRLIGRLGIRVLDYE
jgi:transglutaminase-like putative cysteine protease